ncbi:spore coat protein SP96-like [Haliotis asinina]|uniref:spore coat protein SP96-like n=1 Tax=Haliotis asinina TaxID=109174 RepID=UPI0035327ED2
MESITTSNVVLFLCAVVVCNGNNVDSVLNRSGLYHNVLEGHGNGLFKVTTLTHCERVCLYTRTCTSVNWNPKTKFCQLNPEEVSSETSLQLSTNDIFSRMSIQQKHPCIPNPCRKMEVCIPVMATKGHVCLRPELAASTETRSIVPGTSSPTATTTTSGDGSTTTTVVATTIRAMAVSIYPNATTAPSSTETPPATSLKSISTETAESTLTTPAALTTFSATTALSTTTPFTTATTSATTTSSESTSTEKISTTPTTIAATTTAVTTQTDTSPTTTTSTTTTIARTTTPDCSTYTSSFSKIAGHVVWLLNNVSLYDTMSVSKCEEYCVQNTRFTCRSYEYYYGQHWCFLQSFVKDDALHAWTADPHADYFQRLRNCDVISS